MEELYCAEACSSAAAAAVASLQCSEQLLGTPSTSFHQQKETTRQQQRAPKRSTKAEMDRLNTAQRNSVLASPDRTIFGDERCLLALFETEDRSAPTTDYFGLIQKEVKPHMREATCDWMLDVCFLSIFAYLYFLRCDYCTVDFEFFAPLMRNTSCVYICGDIDDVTCRFAMKNVAIQNCILWRCRLWIASCRLRTFSRRNFKALHRRVC